MGVKIKFENGYFICTTDFNSRNSARQAGFRWNNELKKYVTQDKAVASRLLVCCDASALKELSKYQISVTKWTAPLNVPKGLALLNFQVDAAHFALERNRAYLGLEMGLGKTPIAAVVVSTLLSQEKWAMLYICPPFLTRNVEAEFKKWAPKLSPRRYDKEEFKGSAMIVPDSIINRYPAQDDILNFCESKKKAGFRLILVVDEAMRFKNPLAARTKALFGYKPKDALEPFVPGIADRFERIVYLSGTPMPNRPIELYSVLSHSAPGAINDMNMFDYGRRYCAAKHNGFGWDMSGASNMEELGRLIHGSFMLRLYKKDVLNLPPLTEEIVILGDDLTPKLAEMSQKILRALSPEDLMKGQITAKLEKEEGELHLSTYRKELGLYKVPAALDFINFVLEETNEVLVIFAIHTDVIAALAEGLKQYKPLVITGQTKMEDRHKFVQKFQREDGPRVMIGNILAMGVGLTLTRGTRGIFVEDSWVPGELDQAAARLHRIGQTNPVHIQHLVFENSVDNAVISTVLEKRKVISHI